MPPSISLYYYLPLFNIHLYLFDFSIHTYIYISSCPKSISVSRAVVPTAVVGAGSKLIDGLADIGEGAIDTLADIGGTYGMVWYGMVWYGMVWYGTLYECTAQYVALVRSYGIDLQCMQIHTNSHINIY
jgi:hypothetical protein